MDYVTVRNSRSGTRAWHGHGFVHEYRLNGKRHIAPSEMEQCKPYGRQPLHFTGSYTARSYLDGIKGSSSRGNAAAQFSLGISLFRGDLGEPDLEGAVNWIRRSACAGCPYVGSATSFDGGHSAACQSTSVACYPATVWEPCHCVGNAAYPIRIRYAQFQLGMWHLRGLEPLIAVCERSALQWYAIRDALVDNARLGRNLRGMSC
jgi:TPR repeat protein